MAEWDLASELGRPFTMEVKFDMASGRTGKVAVEHFNTRSWRPSGITETAADLWVYVFSPLSAFVCRAGDLRRFVHRVRPAREVVGGDDNAALLLYPREVILPAVFRRMDGLAPADLRAVLGGLL